MKNDSNKISRFKNFSPEKKLFLSLELYWSARKLKSASLKALNPELPDIEIEKKLKEVFLYARS